MPEPESVGTMASGAVISILGVGGSLGVAPFAASSSGEDSALQEALRMATSRAPGLDPGLPEECSDGLEAFESKRISGKAGEAFCLNCAAAGYAFVGVVGEHFQALAHWRGWIPGESIPEPDARQPILCIAVSGKSNGTLWQRNLRVASGAEALAVGVASVAEKVLPAAIDSGESSPRPWFASPGVDRRVFLEGSKGWGVLCESTKKSAGSFACFPPCHGILLTANSREELAGELRTILASGRTRVLRPGGGAERLAIIAGSEEKLRKRVETALEKLSQPDWNGSPRIGIHLGRRKEVAPKLAWLFDGQGSQHFHMMEELILLFPRFREWLEAYEAVVEPDKGILSQIYPWEGTTPSPEAVAYLNAMEGGASLAFILNLALAELLRRCGVPCEVMAGHSNGENSALIAAGILQMTDEDVLQCCRVLIAEAEFDGDVQGQALAVSLEDRVTFERILGESEDSVMLALDNCPHQVVLFGAVADIAKIREQLEDSGAVCTPLPFQRPFHTPWFESGARALAPFYEVAPVGVGETPVYSCAHVKPFGSTKSDVVAMALSQFHMPVRFRELIETLSSEGVDLFLEVGPGVSLKAFVDDTLGNGRAVSLSSSRRAHSAEAFVSALGSLFVQGVEVDLGDFGFEAKDERVESSPRSGAIAAPEAPRGEAENGSGLRESGVAESPAVAAGSGAAGDSGSVLQQHFSLMNEFLASQRRVFESCFGRGEASVPAASPVETAESTIEDLPWPMLGENLTVMDGRLDARRTFTIQSDPFLLDHTLGRRASRRRAGLYGLPVIPFTFSMELIAEAARRLVGIEKVVTAIEEARGHRWLAVDREELNLRIEAVQITQSPGEVRVQVTIFECLESGTEMKAFEGRVLLADRYPEPPAPRFGEVDEMPPKRLNVPDFYRFGMFHGPRFQNIRRVKHLAPDHVDADLQVFFLDDFFEAGEAPTFQISPNLLDCAGQLTAYSMLEHVGGYYGLFPFRVGALRLYAPPPASGVRVRAQGGLDFDGSNTTMDFDYLNGAGEVLFRLESKQQRCFEFPKRYHMATFWPESGDGLGAPWLRESDYLVERVDGISPDFLDQGWGIWKRALAHMILDEEERKVFYQLPAEGPRRNEWLLGRAAAKAAIRRWARRELDLEIDSADVRICADEKGKPYAECPEIAEVTTMPSLSLSHTKEAAVAAIDPGGAGIGIDLESPGLRKIGDWLKSAFSREELALVNDPAPEALLPLWCAKEAAAKACGTGFGGVPEDWEIVSVDEDRIEVRKGEQSIPVRLFFEEGEIVAACLLTTPEACLS
ncbi:MAG: acyltransferase domain-containing protein [Puniceicoccales bacterium]